MEKKKKTFKRRKTPKDLFDPAQLRREIVAQLRRVFWFYFRPKCLKHYRLQDDQGFYWECSSIICKCVIREDKNAKVDHIEPVMDTELSEQSWDLYIKRLFVGPEKTQILCKPCHTAKTNYENERRKLS